MESLRARGHRFRHARVRRKIRGTSRRPRLTVYRSLRHIYGQIIDDTEGRTIVSCSSLELKEKGSARKTEAAKLVGETIAKNAVKKGVKSIVFDRGGYKYHGRVKALAEGARGSGLEF